MDCAGHGVEIEENQLAARYSEVSCCRKPAYTVVVFIEYRVVDVIVLVGFEIRIQHDMTQATLIVIVYLVLNIEQRVGEEDAVFHHEYLSAFYDDENSSVRCDSQIRRIKVPGDQRFHKTVRQVSGMCSEAGEQQEYGKGLLHGIRLQGESKNSEYHPP